MATDGLVTYSHGGAMQIRNYEDRDLDACRSLWAVLTEHHRQIYNSPGIGGDDPGKLFDVQLAKVGPDRLWVAVDDGEVIGLTGLQPSAEEGELEIEPIVVTPSARGKGVGKALVEHMVGVIKELGLRDLVVRVVGRNEDAIRFYHDMGFNKIGYLELFLDTSPEDEQIWRTGETVAGREFLV